MSHIQSPDIFARLLRQIRRFRRRMYGFTLSAGPEQLPRAWFDSCVRAALRRQTRPAVPFVVADAAIGHDVVFDIDPQLVQFFLGKFQQVNGWSYQAADWFVLPGDWGRTPVSKDSVYHCMQELLPAGQDFMQTATCRAAIHRLQVSGPHMLNGRRVEAPADVESYFRRYLGIADSMRSSGFDQARADASRDLHIGVAIGPDGGIFHFRKGHHRFALARELGVKRIPVKVHVVHADWLTENLTGGRPPHKALIEGLQRAFEKAGNAG